MAAPINIKIVICQPSVRLHNRFFFILFILLHILFEIKTHLMFSVFKLLTISTYVPIFLCG
jgi:hypothetical protein